MERSTRILANTVASYVRLAVAAGSGLIVTPIALHALGVSDYGMFSVICGSLAFLIFINGALTTGAQRHMAFSIGAMDAKQTVEWFNTALIVHVILTTLFLVGAMISSTFILFHLLHFPANRMDAAIWLYRMVVFSMVCDILSTPYQALLMAHEEIIWLSFFSMLGALFLLAGAASIKWLHGDKLLWYSGIYALSRIIILTGPIFYCIYRYPECRRFVAPDHVRRKVKELLAFSSWNLFGAFSSVSRIQGPAVLLNIFVGPVANAAYGVALQVNGFATNLSWGLLRATTAPIVKSHAAKDHRTVKMLSHFSNTFAFGTLWIAVAPLMFNEAYCMHLWLHTPPPGTVMFVNMLLIVLLIDQLTMGYGASLQATGRIAAYQIIVSCINFSAVIVGYPLLKAGLSPQAVLWSMICGAVLACCCRLWLAQSIARIPATEWIKKVLLPTSACVLLSSALTLLLLRMHLQGVIQLGASFLINGLTTGLLLWFFGTTEMQRTKVKSKLAVMLRPSTV